MDFILLLTVYCIRGSADEYIVFSIIVFLSFFSSAAHDWQTRTVTIDSTRGMYEFHRSNKLIYRGHLHNIYIRLKGVNSGSGVTYYLVILSGYQVDEESITSSTMQHDSLAKLGRRLAHKLNLNFFDHQDKSRYHVIRHRCPYKEGDDAKKTHLETSRSESAASIV